MAFEIFLKQGLRGGIQVVCNISVIFCSLFLAHVVMKTMVYLVCNISNMLTKSSTSNFC